MTVSSTFVSGQVLTATDANLMANSGLTYIKQQTVASGSATVTVSSAFSSTYDNYRITFSGYTTSANTFMAIRFSSPGSSYYGSIYYDAYSGASTGTSRTVNGAALDVGRCTLNSAENTIFLDISNPNKADRTGVVGNYFGDGYAGWMGGTNAASTQFTDLTFLPTTGTINGGIITVYGYRKA